MFLCSRGSRGSYWPTNERANTAVVSFSSSSDVWEHKHPLFICVCFRSLTYLHLMILARWPLSLLLLLFLPPYSLHFISARPLRLTHPPAPLLVCRAHPSRQSGQPFVPAVVCVVSVVTRLWLAWREMRPDCACGGQGGGQLSNVSGFGLETWDTERKRAPSFDSRGFLPPSHA